MTTPKPAASWRTRLPRSLSSRPIPIVVGLVTFLAIGFTVGALWIHFGIAQTDTPAGGAVQLRIKDGATTGEIASALLKAGVISNANGFALRSRLTGSDGKLQPGVYDLKTRMSDHEVIDMLESGPAIDYITVTIPEGFRVDQIADRLKREAGIPRAKFLALAQHGALAFAQDHPYLAAAYKGSLEGYLFPKTYQLRKNMTAEQVIEMMLDQFDRETADLDFAAAEARGLTRQQVVVLASMIERESKLDEERPLVSSVIYNRLRKGMRLKIDATIEYVLRDRRLRLTNRDLYTKTPYNTYLHEGLPPGPISNPGLKSLQAAVAPARTRLLYYVLTGKDGSHTFTTNLADFLVAKKKSKEVFGR
jgi:UPF0755 protein